MTPHPVNFLPKPHFINKSVIPTKQHCLRVKKLLQCQQDSSFIYMKGKEESTRDNTDVDLEFRQESNFFYLTGVEEPGFHVIFHLQKEKVYLITPNIPQNETFWKGPNFNSKELLEKFDIDEIINVNEVPNLITLFNSKVVHVLDQNQGIEFMNLSKNTNVTIDTRSLLPALNESRLIKFDWEIDIIRQVMYASSQAHISLMQQFRIGMTENHLAALFRWTCALNQIYKQAYLPIVASGPRTATLHYTKNNQLIPDNKHSLVLVDAGGEKLCYSSDITRTFPVHGIFSDEAKTIYNIVLKMQQTVLSQLRPGVFWSDMEQLAVEILTIELINIGIIKCDSEVQLEELIQRNIPSAFYFHNLGHTLGLDVHDVGGRTKRLEVQEGDDPTVSAFLLNRPLERNMVITIEPGLYFNDILLDIWLDHEEYKNFFDLNQLARYRVVGGVRIEDTIVITENGYENLTVVPKQTHEIESLMNSS